MKFELARLTDHSDESLLAEMRRVVALIDSHVVTQCTFDELSKVHSSTIRKRFGGWRQALTLAGLGDRYSGATVSKKMLSRPVRKYTDDDMIAELNAAAPKLRSSN